MQDWGDSSNWIARFAGWSAPNVRSPWARYGVSLAFTALVLLVRSWLEPILGDHVPYFVLYIAVFFASWYGGLLPAVLAFILGGCVATYNWVVPFRELHAGSVANWMELATYIIVSLVIIGLGEAHRRALESSRQ